MEHKLTVEALKDGTVIDHIPAGQGRRIAKLLRLSESGQRVYMGFNLPSQRSGKKDLIKVENILLSAEDANQLALNAPDGLADLFEWVGSWVIRYTCLRVRFELIGDLCVLGTLAEIGPKPLTQSG